MNALLQVPEAALFALVYAIALLVLALLNKRNHSGVGTHCRASAP